MIKAVKTFARMRSDLIEWMLKRLENRAVAHFLRVTLLARGEPKETALFHLMGVNHIAQSKEFGADPTPDQLSFRDNLVDLMKKVRPVLIAESALHWSGVAHLLFRL